YLRKEKINCEVHLSGDLGTVNSAMTEVFVKEYPKRIIFQRKNTISEMRAVIRHITAQKEAARKEWTYPTEFEAFALNELCQFSGAFCNSLHCDEMGYLCRVPYRVGVGKSQRKNSIPIDHKEWDGTASSREYTSEARQCGDTWDSPESDFDAPILGESGCGLCALYDLGQAGITHLKIVGRGNHPDRMVEDIRAMKRALEILDASKGRETYQKRMKQELFLSGCSKNCYYLPANL
ncbi:MAG: peptidase U32, partial [Lachnospiraceae bacterium]|nr:peptidase U32 [Lachnospiraceae bacterium]